MLINGIVLIHYNINSYTTIQTLEFITSFEDFTFSMYSPKLAPSDSRIKLYLYYNMTQQIFYLYKDSVHIV